MNSLKEKIKKIDNGRFEKLVDVLNIKDICWKCYYFNTSVDPGERYRCYVTPTCIAATLNPDLQRYILEKIKEEGV